MSGKAYRVVLTRTETFEAVVFAKDEQTAEDQSMMLAPGSPYRWIISSVEPLEEHKAEPEHEAASQHVEPGAIAFI